MKNRTLVDDYGMRAHLRNKTAQQTVRGENPCALKVGQISYVERVQSTNINKCNCQRIVGSVQISLQEANISRFLWGIYNNDLSFLRYSSWMTLRRDATVLKWRKCDNNSR